MSSIDSIGAGAHASLTVLRTTLDAQQEQGDSLVELIKQAEQLQTGADADHTPDPSRLLDVIA